MKKPFSCKLLILLHFLLGIGAILGGGALIIDPSGDLLMMPIALLEPTPFTNFLLPGFILFSVLGVIPTFTAIALINRRFLQRDPLEIFQHMHGAWAFSLYIGFTLIIWICIQAFLLEAMAIVHLGYVGAGLMIQAITLLPSVQKHYQIK